MKTVTVKEAALLLGVSESTIWRHLETKRLTAYKRPADRHTYVSQSELDRLLKQQDRVVLSQGS